jgi:hypothetical protein
MRHVPGSGAEKPAEERLDLARRGEGRQEAAKGLKGVFSEELVLDRAADLPFAGKSFQEFSGF